MGDTGLNRRIERALKLLDTAKEHHARSFDCIREAEKILAGERSVGDRLKTLATFFCTAWENHHPGAKYAWGPEAAKNAAMLKKLIAFEDTDEEIERRMIAFLQDQEPYVKSRTHNFGLFYVRYNQYPQSADERQGLTEQERTDQILAQRPNAVKRA